MSPSARSRISNGSAIHDGIDGRSAAARRFRDVFGEIVSELGGADRLSEGQRQLARRCAMLAGSQSVSALVPRPEDVAAWFAFLATLFALPMTAEQLAVYRQCTGRAEPPTVAVRR
jgi:hypothetical protein